ncbi:hypothetical protein [Neobacillus sp. D3-1R]|uniref:hypothetical protein n=1 Tax=Neobacillus sp. D3-1R TaxID=3445778 RepID=UPI003FA03AE2
MYRAYIGTFGPYPSAGMFGGFPGYLGVGLGYGAYPYHHFHTHVSHIHPHHGYGGYPFYW